MYDLAARNSIDVGEFLGMCLAGLSNQFGISGSQIQLAGHSLGSHLMVGWNIIFWGKGRQLLGKSWKDISIKPGQW